MKLFYKKDEYAVDGTLAIRTYYRDEEYGYMAPYGDVTVNLSGYGMIPEEGCIFMPTYKMTDEYLVQVMDEIVDDVISMIPIGYTSGLYVRLKENWEDGVEMIGG